MNKNKVLGFAMVLAGFALIGLCASSSGSVAAQYVGKGVWCLPYFAFVNGFGRLAR